MSVKVRAEITYDNAGLPDWWKGDPAGHAWRVVLRYKGRQMSTPFYTGSALGEPTARDVLECLMSDASSADQSFEDWAIEYGYDLYSRRCGSCGQEFVPGAERTYRAVVAQTAKLRRLLGEDYDEAVFGEDQESWAKTHIESS